MKGKIDKKGGLYIERAGKMKLMNCRQATTYSWGSFSVMHCADTCSQFGEPYQSETQGSSSHKKISKIYLEICRSKIIAFYELTDER